jgi:hypothetical protein
VHERCKGRAGRCALPGIIFQGAVVVLVGVYPAILANKLTQRVAAKEKAGNRRSATRFLTNENRPIQRRNAASAGRVTEPVWLLFIEST